MNNKPKNMDRTNGVEPEVRFPEAMLRALNGKPLGVDRDYLLAVSVVADYYVDCGAMYRVTFRENIPGNDSIFLRLKPDGCIARFFSLSIVTDAEELWVDTYEHTDIDDAGSSEGVTVKNSAREMVRLDLAHDDPPILVELNPDLVEENEELQKGELLEYNSILGEAGVGQRRVGARINPATLWILAVDTEYLIEFANKDDTADKITVIMDIGFPLMLPYAVIPEEE